MPENSGPNPFQVDASLGLQQTEADSDATRLPLLRVAIALATISVLHIYAMLYLLAFAYGDGTVEVADDPFPMAAAAFTSFSALVLLLGSFNMMRSGTYSQANIIFILAMVPLIAPCYSFSIPIGIWGLLVLRRPEVKNSFGGGQPKTMDLQESLSESELAAKDLTPQLRPIAICLILPCALHILINIWYFWSTEERLFAWYFTVPGLCSAFLIFGSISMLRRSSYMLSMLTCILALVPGLTPCLFVAIPIGLWGLVVMSQPKVRQAFQVI